MYGGWKYSFSILDLGKVRPTVNAFAFCKMLRTPDLCSGVAFYVLLLRYPRVEKFRM